MNDDDEDLLASMSHELRAPLHAILGWVQLLRANGQCGPESDRALEIIERNARLEARAVDEAIDLARIASGRLAVQRESLRLVESLRAAVVQCEAAAEARQVRIDVRVEPELRVRGDLGRLVQITRDLVASAVRRTVPGGTVEVRAVRRGADAVLSVREDHGATADAASRERITVRRRRLALIGDGRGMSVAVARGLVRLHGGTLSEEEDGSLMVVRLPAVVRPAPGHRPAAPLRI